LSGRSECTGGRELPYFDSALHDTRQELPPCHHQRPKRIHGHVRRCCFNTLSFSTRTSALGGLSDRSRYLTIRSEMHHLSTSDIAGVQRNNSGNNEGCGKEPQRRSSFAAPAAFRCLRASAQAFLNPTSSHGREMKHRDSAMPCPRLRNDGQGSAIRRSGVWTMLPRRSY
jgi:hypothetical protein